MHVVVTRPEPDALAMTARLEAIGCRVTLAPLISIAHRPIATDALAGASGLIATSRNAIEALARSPALGKAIALPIFTVGTATAARARQVGFATVITGPGAAAELASVVAAHPAANAGPLVHLAGDHVAVDLTRLLNECSVDCRSLVVYHSIAATELPENLLGELADGIIDAAIFMSPRTARIWRTLIGAAPASIDASRLAYVCLSESVAAPLREPIWSPKIMIAPVPTLDGALGVIQQLASAPREE